MGISVDVSISAAAVFIQGLLSFLSPCVLPLIPVYFGYLSGGTASRDAEGRLHFSRKKVISNTLLFIIGIGFAFFVLGMGMNALGRFFGGNQLLFARIGGIVVILFGLYQLGVFGFSKRLGRDYRLPYQFKSRVVTPLIALVMGFVFSFAWTPCVGPVLASVLLLTASSAGSGMLYILLYTLGFVIPFMVVGLFATSLLDIFRKHMNVVKYTVKVGAVLLIIMGVLMITGGVNGISSYLSRVSGNTQTIETSSISGSGETAPAIPEEEAQPGEPAEASSSDSAQTEVFPAPDFELTDQYGTVHRLSDYRGKVVFLNFWATWCPPCRAEMPDIQILYEKYAAMEDPEVVVLGVAFPDYGGEESEEGIIEFLQSNNYTYPVVMDASGELAAEYYISAYPTTFMIDKNGNIFGYATGMLEYETMEDIIRQTIEGKRQ